MTIGLYFANNKEAVVISDPRISYDDKLSDYGKKYASFTRKTYHGVIISEGDDFSAVEGVLQHIPSLTKSHSLDAFVDLVTKEFHKVLEKRVPLKKKINVSFFVVGYNKNKKELVKYHINKERKKEIFDTHYDIGIGGTSATAYYMAKLNGIDVQCLNIESLLFFALNSYSFATVSENVGGIPNIAHVSKDGVDILPREKAIALANLSGVFLSENNPALREKDMLRYLRQILSSEKPPYEQIAEILGVDRNTLTSLYVPFSSWQGRANHRIFGQGQE